MTNMKYIYLTLLLCVCVVLLGCNKPTACVTSGNASGLKLLVLSHAEADAKKAFANGDRRLLGFFSVGLEVPGFPGDPGTYSPGIRLIEGTSDVICSQEDGQLNKNAWLYARQYNQQMIFLTNVKQ